MFHEGRTTYGRTLSFNEGWLFDINIFAASQVGSSECLTCVKHIIIIISESRYLCASVSLGTCVSALGRSTLQFGRVCNE